MIYRNPRYIDITAAGISNDVIQEIIEQASAQITVSGLNFIGQNGIGVTQSGVDIYIHNDRVDGGEL